MLKSLLNFISRNFIFPKVEIKTSEDLSGKVVIVTGSSRGIGKAVAETLVARSAKVVAVSRDINDLKAVFKDSESILCIGADVTSETAAKDIIAQTLQKFGKIDVLVNNAGINIEKPIEETDLDEFERIFDVNLKATFLMCKYAVPVMKNQKDGLIVNIGSKISHNTQVAPNKVLYASTKYALEGFSIALNRELKSSGIRVSCLMPGTVNTFVSLNAKDFLSPYHVAEVIATMIRLEEIDFESLVIKSKNQDI